VGEEGIGGRCRALTPLKYSPATCARCDGGRAACGLTPAMRVRERGCPHRVNHYEGGAVVAVRDGAHDAERRQHDQVAQVEKVAGPRRRLVLRYCRQSVGTAP